MSSAVPQACKDHTRGPRSPPALAPQPAAKTTVHPLQLAAVASLAMLCRQGVLNPSEIYIILGPLKKVCMHAVAHLEHLLLKLRVASNILHPGNAAAPCIGQQTRSHCGDGPLATKRPASCVCPLHLTLLQHLSTRQVSNLLNTGIDENKSHNSSCKEKS